MSFSDCHIKFKGEKDIINEIIENTKKYGFNWGQTKISSDNKEEKKRKWGMEWNIKGKEAIPVHYSLSKDGKRAEVEYSIIGGKTGASNWFEILCRHYKIDGNYVNSDIVNNFFIEMSYKNGKKTKNIEEEYISKECLEYYGIEKFKTACIDELLYNKEFYEKLRPKMIEIAKGTIYEDEMVKWIEELDSFHKLERSLTVEEAYEKGMLVHVDEFDYLQVFYDEKNNTMGYAVGNVSPDYKIIMKEGDFVDKEGAIEAALKEFENEKQEEENEKLIVVEDDGEEDKLVIVEENPKKSFLKL